MSKETIKIRGVYIGDDQLKIKKGEPICIEFNKHYLKTAYIDNAYKRHINNMESITLIEYVRQKANRVFLTNSLYL